MTLSTSKAISTSTVTHSIGVNTHLDYQSYGYQNINTVAAAINYLGIKNLRDTPDNPNTVGPSGSWQQIANATGAKFDAYMVEGSPALDVATLDYAKQLAAQGILNYMEGGNENDVPAALAQGNSIAWTASFQQQVYAAGHALGLPVINMSFGAGWTSANNWEGNYDKVGDLSAYCNYANAHTYPGVGQTPDATIQRLNTDAQLAASSRPVITTEIGWSNSSFSQADAARFALDAVFDGIKDGDVKSYFYALFNDASGQFGLMNADGSAKPAGAALHNLTTIMADSGAARTDSLTYGLSGTTANDHSLLMEKSTGTFQLAIWNETDAAHNVTLNLGAAAQTIRIYDPLTGTSAVTSYSNASSVTVNVHPSRYRGDRAQRHDDHDNNAAKPGLDRAGCADHERRSDPCAFRAQHLRSVGCHPCRQPDPQPHRKIGNHLGDRQHGPAAGRFGHLRHPCVQQPRDAQRRPRPPHLLIGNRRHDSADGRCLGSGRRRGEKRNRHHRSTGHDLGVDNGRRHVVNDHHHDHDHACHDHAAGHLWR